MASIDDEIKHAVDMANDLMREYVAWHQKIQTGEIGNMAYSDIFEFTNFRMETASSCLLLIENMKVADALGLCRALLENYMLLILMCRGTKYFKIENLESKSPEQFAAYLKEQQTKLEELRERGEADALYVVKNTRGGPRRLMWVFEGLTNPDEPDFVIPAHFFQFQQFDPKAHRLKDEDYFEYVPASPEESVIRRTRRREAGDLYRFYLSYDSLRECLILNDILDEATQTRLEAHYTFLGQFLHPTHNAARELHEGNNYYSGRPTIGMEQPYTKFAILLAALYVTYLLAGILEEVARFVESAPTRYIADAGTGELRKLIESVPVHFPYFWFIFNRPPLWDKFNYAIHKIDDDELPDFESYMDVPDDRIPFDSDIYKHLEFALTAARNGRIGAYASPLADRNAAPIDIIGFPISRE